MAGHSKWANIKHRKGRQDAKRSKIWSKCSRAIIVAAKNGGGDPTMNLSLRYAIDEAKASNMPKDTIEKAVKKGSGEGSEGVRYEEIRYEGYGPHGVAIIVDVLTDNVNRAAAEIRKIFEKGGGNLGKPGAVSFGFNARGVILIEASKVDEEKIMEIALEAGAEDIENEGEAWEITTQPTDFISVREAIEAVGIEIDSAELTMLPQNTVDCDATAAEKVLRMVDNFEDHDDVQKVYTNADIPDEVMANLG
ncbi:MAG: YebC/PmpR family DNA-binding transcriptional regulator [Planctomycetota bacterium]|nr:YebC/PmpR family DNA-binding transcriptional regulator [Planctomycetota bacterium]